MKLLCTQDTIDNARSRDLLPLECEFCHKKYELKVKIIRECQTGRITKRFCSTQCNSKFNLLKSLPNTKCLFCSKELHRCKSHLKRSNGNSFCSKKCSSKYSGNIRKKTPKINKAKPNRLKRERISIPKENPIIEIDIIHQKTPEIKIFTNCLNCKKSTNNSKFCCGTCRNEVNNKNIKGQKSKAEKLLVKAIKENFPNWTIIENNRNLLNGLELDVYIPEIKLAIEWNGIFHYEPIRGNESLAKITSKDNRKIELCKSLGIELIVICDRTSHPRFVKETISELINNLKKIQS